MVLVNYAGKEINAKLVYYGPGLSGKTTNLEYIYTSVPATHRGKMVSMKTKTERTLFFDFLPLDLGDLGGYRTRFLLYTVPGQVYYNATRKLVLKGVDAVVFVADSRRAKMDENRESLQNLHDNLRELGLELGQIPWVMQYNKRDLPDAAPVEELNRALNAGGVPFVLATASRGEGVFDTFKEVSKLLLKNLSKNLGPAVLPRPAARPVARPVAGLDVSPARAVEPPHGIEMVRAAEMPRETDPPVAEPASSTTPLPDKPPSVERDEDASRFIVSDPPRPAANRSFAPTIDPSFAAAPPAARAGEPAPFETPEAGAGDEPAMSEPAGPEPFVWARREGGRSQNGRPRNGIFGWLRRPKPAQDDLAGQEAEGEPISADTSDRFEKEPPLAAGPAPEEEVPAMAAPASAKASLQLVQGEESARAEETVDAALGEIEDEPAAVHEVTLPIVVPEGCKEVRLVVRLLVPQAAEQTPEEREVVAAQRLAAR